MPEHGNTESPASARRYAARVILEVGAFRLRILSAWAEPNPGGECAAPRVASARDSQTEGDPPPPPPHSSTAATNERHATRAEPPRATSMLALR